MNINTLFHQSSIFITRGKVICLLVAFCLLALTACQPDNYVCIYNDTFDKADRGAFIEDGQCNGYVFKATKNVKYHGNNTGNQGKMEITIEEGHESWLSGRTIYFSEGHNPDTSFTARFIGSQVSSEKRDVKLFNSYLGLPTYLDKITFNLEKKPSAGMSHLRFYHLGDKAELPFYIRCHFHEINPDVANMNKKELARVQCRVMFDYNPAVTVNVLVSYVDLENTLLKVAEIHQFINQLIVVQQKGVLE